MSIRNEDLEETGRAAIVREIDQTASDAYHAATFEEARGSMPPCSDSMVGTTSG